MLRLIQNFALTKVKVCGFQKCHPISHHHHHQGMAAVDDIIKKSKKLKCSDWFKILHEQRLGYVGFENMCLRIAPHFEAHIKISQCVSLLRHKSIQQPMWLSKKLKMAANKNDPSFLWYHTFGTTLFVVPSLQVKNSKWRKMFEKNDRLVPVSNTCMAANKTAINLFEV